jgi:hypothetical protein
MKSFLWSSAILSGMALALFSPIWIGRQISSATAQREAQESKERVIRWTRKSMDALVAKHRGESFEQWAETDRFAYESMRRGLHDLCEESPKNLD